MFENPDWKYSKQELLPQLTSYGTSYGTTQAKQSRLTATLRSNLKSLSHAQLIGGELLQPQNARGVQEWQ